MSSSKKQPILGMFAGMLLSFFGCANFYMALNKTLPQVWETVLGVSVSGAIIGFLLGVYGNRALNGQPKYLTIGTLTGVIVGLLCGVAVTEILSERAIDIAGLDRDDPFFGKLSAGIRISYRTYGLCLGPLVGGIAGTLIGLRLWSERRVDQ